MCLCDDECLEGDFIDCLLEPENMLLFNQLYIEGSYFDSSDDECEYEDNDLTSEDRNEVYVLREDYCSS